MKYSVWTKDWCQTQISCSFGEYLELCLADKGLEQIPGTENIPENVKMTHLKAVWNSAVQLSDDFHKERQSAAAWEVVKAADKVLRNRTKQMFSLVNFRY